MKYLWVGVGIVFVFSSVRSQDIKLACNYSVGDDSTISLELNLVNQSTSTVYIPVTDWEVTGMVDGSGATIGFPDSSRLINMILYSHSTLNKSPRIGVVGEKGDYTHYSHFPKVITIAPTLSKTVLIRIRNEQAARLRRQNLDYETSIAYCSTAEWRKLERDLKLKLKKAIAKVNSREAINVPYLDEPFWLNSSEIRTSWNKSDKIRKAFHRRVWGSCSTTAGH